MSKEKMCGACATRGKTWRGGNPRCAFSGGLFDENWNCATVNMIRDICDERQKKLPSGVEYQYCEDQKYAIIKVDDLDIAGSPLALWVSWYKNRGATDAMWLLHESAPPRRPKETECLKIIRAYTGACDSCLLII